MRKMIHFIWGGPEMPEEYRANLRAWHDLHDGWEIMVWSDDDLRWLEHRDLYDRAASHVPDDALWQFRSDIARYEILRKYGGLYVDTDVTPLRSIEPAIDWHQTFAVAETPRWVANTILYVDRPHHRVMEQIVADLRKNVVATTPNRPNVLSGPLFLTPRWRAYNCHVAETKLFFPLSFTDAMKGREIDHASLPPETYTIHRWGHIRDLRGNVRDGYTRRAARLDRQRSRRAPSRTGG